MAKLKLEEKMVSFTVQVSRNQDENIYLITDLENAKSKSEIVRKAIDLYVEPNYPQLLQGKI